MRESFESDDSHPFWKLPSQSLMPLWQAVITHALFWHCATPFTVAQLRPQAPQLRASLCVLAQKLPHRTVPGLHPMDELRQAPATHSSPTAQLRPQAPQLAGLVCTSRQASPQRVKVELHEIPQAPAAQVAVPFVGTGQVRPQAPQWFADPFVSTQRSLPQRV